MSEPNCNLGNAINKKTIGKFSNLFIMPSN